MTQFLLAEFEAKRQYACIIDNPKQLLIEHTHDFYELTLVHSGSCIHVVNGEKIRMNPACLVLVRPSDRHCFQPLTANFQIINVIIGSSVLEAMFTFLGNGFQPERLIATPLPPMVQISHDDFVAAQNEFKQLMLYKSLLGHNADAHFHITLLNLITRHFPMTMIHNRTNVPEWLQWLVLEMYKKDNMVEGLPAMQRLCNKSSEHLCRTCKKRLGLSPTQLINDIRLRHAARLLLETDQKIIDIVTEVGFDNLSYFYHGFKSIYCCSPKAFRSRNDPSAIQGYKIVDTIFPQTLPPAVPPQSMDIRLTEAAL